MDTKLKGYASSSAPWRRGAPWYLVIAEGAALVAVGLYALIAPGSARETVFALFGIILVLNGAGAAWAGFRNEPTKMTSFLSFRGGIGFSLGLLALLARFSDAVNSDAARIILAFGFLLVGIVSLVALFIARDERKFPLGTLVWNVILIVIAIALFTGSEDDDSRLKLTGWIAIILGGLLVAFGFYLRQKAAAETAGASTGTIDSTSSVDAPGSGAANETIDSGSAKVEEAVDSTPANPL